MGLPLNEDIVIGATTLRVVAGAAAASAVEPPVGPWAGRQVYTPAASAPPPVYAAPAAPGGQTVSGPPGQPKPRRPIGMSVALLAGGTLLCVLLVGVVGVAGFYLYQRNTGTTVTERVPTTFEKQDVTLVKPDGVPVTDAQGVSLTAPTGSFETAVVVQMTSYKVSGGLAQALGDQYEMAVPFYSITAQGKNGSTRALDLSFPAASSESRLLEVIDHEYAGVLDVLPENGKLSVKTLAGPEDIHDMNLVLPSGRGASIAYTVITPKTGAAFVAPGLASSARLVPAAGQFCYPGSPGPRADYGGDDQKLPPPDEVLAYFSGFGAYAQNPASPNLVWHGTLPEGVIGASEMTVGVDKVTLHYRVEVPKPATSSSPMLAGLLSQQVPTTAGPPAPRHSPWVLLWPALPAIGLVAWQRRRLPRRSALLAGLVVAVLGLAGCTGVDVWGSFETTYTYDRLEHVSPPPAAAGASAPDQALKWNLTNGQMRMELDLTISSETTDADGKKVVTEEKCVLTINSAATGTVGPADSVKPPE